MHAVFPRLPRICPSPAALGTRVPYGFVLEAGSGVATGRPAASNPIWA